MLTSSRSLYALHEYQPASASEDKAHQERPSLWSELALEYTTRIVIDVARAFNDNFSSLNMTAIPPGYTNILLRAGLHRILASSQVENAPWLADLESLRNALWFFKHRWKISGKWPDRN
jgi:hypothetical protein